MLNNVIYAAGDRPTISWEAYIDRVLSDEDSKDVDLWKPQIDQWWYGTFFMPTYVALFEKVDFSPFKQSKRNINASSKWDFFPISTYREDEIQEKYWEDMALWNVINEHNMPYEELLCAGGR